MSAIDTPASIAKIAADRPWKTSSQGQPSGGCSLPTWLANMPSSAIARATSRPTMRARLALTGASRSPERRALEDVQRPPVVDRQAVLHDLAERVASQPGERGRIRQLLLGRIAQRLEDLGVGRHESAAQRRVVGVPGARVEVVVELVELLPRVALGGIRRRGPGARLCDPAAEQDVPVVKVTKDIGDPASLPRLADARIGMRVGDGEQALEFGFGIGDELLRPR